LKNCSEAVDAGGSEPEDCAGCEPEEAGTDEAGVADEDGPADDSAEPSPEEGIAPEDSTFSPDDAGLSAEDADSPELDEPAGPGWEPELPEAADNPSDTEDEDCKAEPSPTASLPGPVEESLPEPESPEHPAKAIAAHAKKIER
jgi:hypothetical protein